MKKILIILLVFVVITLSLYIYKTKYYLRFLPDGYQVTCYSKQVMNYESNLYDILIDNPIDVEKWNMEFTLIGKVESTYNLCEKPTEHLSTNRECNDCYLYESDTGFLYIKIIEGNESTFYRAFSLNDYK